MMMTIMGMMVVMVVGVKKMTTKITRMLAMQRGVAVLMETMRTR